MRTGQRLVLLGSLLASAGLATPAAAATVVLDFEGLGNFEPVNDFYNGGTGGSGSSGTDYGINFSTDSLAIIDADAGGGGNFANEPSPSTVLFFLSGGAAVMNVAAGFDTGFSFFYSAINNPGVVNVYDGLNGTGNILATLNLTTTGTACSGDPSGQFCSWNPVGVTFGGTAFSVGFGGTQNQIAYDNITLGSSNPGGGGNNAVPEPGTWAMMLIGFGAIGFTMRRQRRQKLRHA
jgi:hypothetical protein